MSDPASKLIVYFGERTRVEGRLLADVLLDLCARHSIRLSVLMRGIQGFGAKHGLRSDRLLTLSEDLPLVAVVIDRDERIQLLIGELAALDTEALMTVERARFVDDAHGVPVSGSLDADASKHLKLTVCIGRHERLGGQPAFAYLCGLLRDAGVAGASALLGVDGTIEGERRRARFLAHNRGVPLLVVSFGKHAAVERALGSIAERLPSALSLVERAHVCKRDGQLLTSVLAKPAPTRAGENDAQAKLTIVTSGAAHHGSRPVHLELIRRLREQGAAGATSLRGIWGFHGNHTPHGDRLLSLRRHVPVIIELIDTAPRIDEWFAVVDELTQEAGLVTRALVPVCRSLEGRVAL